MYLAEVVSDYNVIKEKIKTLNDLLFGSNRANEVGVVDALLKELLNLIDKKRSHLILLNELNNKVRLKIGATSLDLATALLIRDAFKVKIEVVDALLRTHGCSGLDVVSLLDQKDKLIKEYNALSSSIQKLEWSLDIDDKKSLG